MATKDQEWGLLCCIVKDPNALAQCASEGLGPSDMQNQLYRALYTRMRSLWESDDKAQLDEVTLNAQFGDRFDKLLEEEGLTRKKLFDNLFTNHVSVDNTGAFIASIMDRSYKDALQADIKSLGKQFLENGKDLTAGEMLAMVEDVAQSMYKRVNVEKTEIIGGKSNLFARLQARDSRQIYGLATPWPTVNDRLSGLPPGSLTLWVSPTGTGKTAAMVNLMEHVAIENKIPALKIGVEMSAEEIMLRLVSCRSWVPERDLRLNNKWMASDQAFDRVKKACYDIDSVDTFHYLLMPEFTISKIRGHAIRAKMRHNIQLLILDYVSEPDEDGASKRQEWQNLSQFMWRLHGLAQQLQIPIVATGQTPIITNRDWLAMADVALAKYMSFHCDHVLGVINKTPKTIGEEKLIPGIGKTVGNQKLYFLKARHGGEIREEDMAHPYLNMQYDRPIQRVREGLYPPHKDQYNK